MSLSSQAQRAPSEPRPVPLPQSTPQLSLKQLLKQRLKQMRLRTLRLMSCSARCKRRKRLRAHAQRGLVRSLPLSAIASKVWRCLSV